MSKSKSKPVQKDTSPYVAQKEKINFTLNIKDLPWTDKQKDFISLALDKGTKILLVKGYAGTSKTLLSIYCALHLLNQKRVSDLILVRPAVESSDSKLGFLPGDLTEKFGVYTTPFMDKMEELLPTNIVKKLYNEKIITLCPVNFARGLHWSARVVVADEVQNFTLNELKTLLTRIGQFTKVFLCGDITQSDLTNGKGSGFEKIFNWFNSKESKENGIYTFEFTKDDILRSDLCRHIIDVFERELVKIKN